MICKLIMLFRRAKHILQTEGLVPLIRRGFAFLIRRGFAFLAPYFFMYGTYYLYEHIVNESKKADFLPGIRGLTFRIVSTNQQADELIADGLEFRSYVLDTRQWLGRGAIAFCIFVDGELAHISWVAMTAEVKGRLTELPFQVNFSNNEAYWGRLETNPRYQRMGLWGYSYHKILKFMRERGIVTLRFVVHTNNISTQRGYAKFGARRYAKARYLRILWWKFWKERPLATSQ